MAWSLVQQTATQTTNGTCTLPANSTAGNLLILFASSPSNTAITPPPGFSTVGNIANSTVNETYVFASFNTAGGVSSFTCTGPATIESEIAEFTCTGVASVSAASSTGTNTAGAVTSVTVTSGTGALAGDLVVVGALWHNATAAAMTWTDPSGFTEVSTLITASATNHGYAARNLSASAGGAQSVTVTGSAAGGTQGWSGVVATFTEPGAGGVTWAPQRYGQAAPPSMAPWWQRDRRDANTVATAANPLVSPLDTAWQAGAGYSHLYNDSHLRDRRAYFYQRNYVSPPGLLATAELENELLGGADTARHQHAAVYTDRREVPQQPPRLADPLLIQTALLENELLGSADDLARHRAWYTDRREVPQQRQYYLPYAPFLLENELLGGAETIWHAWWWRPGSWPQQRAYISDPSFYPSGAVTDPLTVAWGAGGNYWHIYNRAAGVTDRREVPQQRAYVSDPLLLTTAELENELLGGAQAPRTYATPATHYDRREVPQQPLRLADPSLIGTAELENELLGTADGQARHRAWYADRREVPQQRTYYLPQQPFLLENELLGGAQTIWHAWWWRPGSWPQQRAYISDPSFYPAGAVTDPLTVAWGAGGNYWHTYNRAAGATDRREVPQQRAYVSDPLLLTTAELENELLGGAQAWAHYITAAYYDRREVLQQRQYWPVPVPFLLENELLGGADDLQRHRAWFTGRWPYPAQRPGGTLPDVPADPLTLPGDTARRYLAAGYWPRGWSWFQRLYFPVPAPPLVAPFTVGALTAATAPTATVGATDNPESTLTASTAAQSTITATDQRMGGPG